MMMMKMNDIQRKNRGKAKEIWYVEGTAESKLCFFKVVFPSGCKKCEKFSPLIEKKQQPVCLIIPIKHDIEECLKFCVFPFLTLILQ